MTEFAVVASVFFLLILGFIELARGLMVAHLLTNAARAGCRTGIIEGKANSDVTTAVSNILTAQGISGDSVTVLVNDGSGDIVNSKAGDEITVTVSIPTSKVTWLPGGHYLVGNLSGQYTLKRE
jgi:Flp pilus assembly protein TadG